MLSYNSSYDISPSQPFKIVSKFFIFPKMLGSNPNIPSIYPSLLSLIFVSRPLYYSTTTTSSLPPLPLPRYYAVNSSEAIERMCSRAHASCWSVSEPLGEEEQVKIKGVENWGKNMERGWILANRANARASFNNSNEPITRSRCKSARVDLVRGGLRTWSVRFSSRTLRL